MLHTFTSRFAAQRYLEANRGVLVLANDTEAHKFLEHALANPLPPVKPREILDPVTGEPLAEVTCG